MARLSKKERIRQHQKVYGKTFDVNLEWHEQPIVLNVKVTKLIKKNNKDAMYITITGEIPHRTNMMQYNYGSVRLFAYVVWGLGKPILKVRGNIVGDRMMHSSMAHESIIKGCENVLLEITILGEPDEQDSKTQTN